MSRIIIIINNVLQDWQKVQDPETLVFFLSNLAYLIFYLLLIGSHHISQNRKV